MSLRPWMLQFWSNYYFVRNVNNVFDKIMFAETVLYDKRRQECYKDIPIVYYTNVSSTISVQCGYNILVGQLHRGYGY